MANKEIRRRMAAAGIKHWQVAQRLGIHEVTLVRWLRTELPEDKYHLVLNAIDELEKDGSGYGE